MAGRIRQADVDEVKARTNIADIVGERVALKPAGVGSLKGLCPFHDERSPSFHVRPQHGFYHCFGCGASGDVYTFIREMDHLSFTETVERLAARIGYPLHYEDGGSATETSGRARLYAANAAAVEFFREQLRTGDADAARQFLGGRGFDAGGAAHFGVGYAPQGWSSLQQALRSQGFSDEELLAAGLLSQGQRGVYDRFRGRVVWPIRDVTGQTVGFGARRLFDEDKGPKYLNTPETAIYRKSQVLYGLDLAKKDISRSHRVVVVEGYTDVMACHLAGVTSAVATCGTAFGADHITVLRRIMGDDTAQGEVIFTFDPDQAGTNAAMRAFADEKRFAAQTYVATGPAGLDPCDLRLQRGDGAVRAMLDAKVPMFEFAIDQRIAPFDLDTVEGRAGALRAAAPIVAGIRDTILQPGYVRVLARRLGEDIAPVAQAVRQAARQDQTMSRAPEVPAGLPDEPGVTSPRLITLPQHPDTALERDALMGALQYGHRVDEKLLRRAMVVTFRTPALDVIRGTIAAVPDFSRLGWASEAVSQVREPFRTLAAELLTGPFPERDDERAIAASSDLARRLCLREIEERKRSLLGAIQRVSPDSEEGRALRMELRALDAERQALIAVE